MGGYLDRPHSSSLADVLNVILDKGLVIDAYVQLSLLGVDVLSVDARFVVASVDTYLRYAEATNRLDLAKQTEGKAPPDLAAKAFDSTAETIAHDVAQKKTENFVENVKDFFTPG
ncbi:gas vesicle protein GvpJ [Sinomonas terrae]|uniref:Gas vesicle protein A n=1 Tax=Sinomonas terrae TaxID=2908838 RepID=A0ABS9U465_9MICC|nr:gas vesicle protein GvpJ [Sinomonas terrae]MCH6471479.1 gas vesicle protein [Sinomonas terrae]